MSNTEKFIITRCVYLKKKLPQFTYYSTDPDEGIKITLFHFAETQDSVIIEPVGKYLYFVKKVLQRSYHLSVPRRRVVPEISSAAA